MSSCINILHECAKRASTGNMKIKQLGETKGMFKFESEDGANIYNIKCLREAAQNVLVQFGYCITEQNIIQNGEKYIIEMKFDGFEKKFDDLEDEEETNDVVTDEEELGEYVVSLFYDMVGVGVKELKAISKIADHIGLSIEQVKHFLESYKEKEGFNEEYKPLDNLSDFDDELEGREHGDMYSDIEDEFDKEISEVKSLAMKDGLVNESTDEEYEGYRTDILVAFKDAVVHQGLSDIRALIKVSADFGMTVDETADIIQSMIGDVSIGDADEDIEESIDTRIDFDDGDTYEIFDYIMQNLTPDQIINFGVDKITYILVKNLGMEDRSEARRIATNLVQMVKDMKETENDEDIEESMVGAAGITGPKTPLLKKKSKQINEEEDEDWFRNLDNKAIFDDPEYDEKVIDNEEEIKKSSKQALEIFKKALLAFGDRDITSNMERYAITKVATKMGIPYETARQYINKSGSINEADEASEPIDPRVPAYIEDFEEIEGKPIEEIDDEEDFHSKMEELGIDPHEAEEMIYKVLNQLINQEEVSDEDEDIEDETIEEDKETFEIEEVPDDVEEEDVEGENVDVEKLDEITTKEVIEKQKQLLDSIRKYAGSLPDSEAKTKGKIWKQFAKISNNMAELEATIKYRG